jgi:hypothetical protein
LLLFLFLGIIPAFEISTLDHHLFVFSFALALLLSVWRFFFFWWEERKRRERESSILYPGDLLCYQFVRACVLQSGCVWDVGGESGRGNGARIILCSSTVYDDDDSSQKRIED